MGDRSLFCFWESHRELERRQGKAEQSNARARETNKNERKESRRIEREKSRRTRTRRKEKKRLLMALEYMSKLFYPTSSNSANSFLVACPRSVCHPERLCYAFPEPKSSSLTSAYRCMGAKLRILDHCLPRSSLPTMPRNCQSMAVS